MFRVAGAKDEGVMTSSSFEKWHKAQMNSAEYHGIFMGMYALLKLGWDSKGSKPSTSTNVACGMAAISSYLFAAGTVLSTHKGANPDLVRGEQPHIFRPLGAIGRY